MTFTFGPAFITPVASPLSAATASSFTARRPRTLCPVLTTTRVATIRATATPPPRSPRPSSSRNPALAALAASVLAFTLPSLPTQPIAQPIAPALAKPAARGGGASFSSASGDVIKDPEALLRWSLPINNKTVRSLQTELEAAVSDLKGLKWKSVDGHLKKAAYVINNQTDKIIADVPAARADDARALLARVEEALPALDAAVAEKAADKVIEAGRSSLRLIGDVEQMMVTDFPYAIPEEFNGLPWLRGRATVELVVRKAGDEVFDINGTLYNEGRMTLVLDGYSAPVSAGDFVDLVDKGFYNGNEVVRSDGFIIQAGKPANGDGYKDDKSGAIRNVPLEVFARGDKMPLYGMTLEDDGRGAAGTVLPFTSFGTLALARNETEANTASSQFFWFLFEPDLTPAGRNLMDGNWAVFGYTTKGEQFLKGMQKGDRIVSAKVVDGLDNLVR